MSTIISGLILVLSMVIFLFLQIVPGAFTIFYHFTLGKNSKKKSDDLALSFILGTEIFNTAIWLLTYLTIFAIFYYNPTFTSSVIIWILAGISFALAIVSFFFYFKKGKNTTTFLPRRLVRGIIMRSKSVKTRTDAIILGFFTCVPELLFTLPVFFSVNSILQNTTVLPRALIIIFAVILTTVPLFIIRGFFHTGYNLAEITRIRIKLKPHFRIILTLAFTALALALVNYGVINHG